MSRAVRRRIGAAAVMAVAAALSIAAAAPRLGLLDGKAMTFFDATGPQRDTVAVFLSGDLGLRFGLNARIVPALRAEGLRVAGVSSPTLFGTRRTRTEVDEIVSDAIRTALDRTGAARVLLIGQSYGADIVATAAPDLPPDLRARAAAVVLVVPGRQAYFRADPLGFAYHGTPDAEPAAGMRRVDWASVVCVYGVEERDSLCPMLDATRARVVALPGGHFLNHDNMTAVTAITSQLRLANALGSR